MDRPEPLDREFAHAWLRSQRRFWEAWARGTSEDADADPEAAWARACEQWWLQVSQDVPAPLASQLQTALQQTRLCLKLALDLGRGNAPSAVPIEPALMFGAAVDTAYRAAAVPRDSPDGAYLVAYQALVSELARITQQALGRVRDALARDEVRSPQHLYTVYAHAIESCFREQAGSEEFSRLVGDLVNAWVALRASRNERRDE